MRCTLIVLACFLVTAPISRCQLDDPAVAEQSITLGDGNEPTPERAPAAVVQEGLPTGAMNGAVEPDPGPVIAAENSPVPDVATSAVTAQGSKKVKDKHFKGPSGVKELDKNSAAAQRIAAKHGMTVAKLKKELKTEQDLAVDMETEEIVYSCEGLAVPAGVVSGSSAYADTPEPSTADGGAFKLHSRPGSTRIIYLDFDGHNATGTAWNSSGIISTPPFSIDNDITTAFSLTELTYIVNIWRAVAEDFAPFDVDVTTEYPGSEDRLENSAGTGPGMRVAIGGSSYDWYGAGAGGVAYVGVFGSSFYAPAYVFTAQLGTGTPKYVAEAISHEVGHTLGLSHDGGLNTGYYAGHGQWAPIMGVGYYKPITQWSKGEYAYATQLQDDVAIIRTKLGTVLPQDSGTTISNAWSMQVINSTDTTQNARVSAILEFGGQEEMFFFISGSAGTVQATATVAPNNGFVRANLDLQLTLYDAAGAAVETADLPTDTGATPDNMGATLIKAIGSAGTYYLGVKSKGYGDPVNIGYSTYASLGQYTLTVTYPWAPPPSPPPSPPPNPPPPSPPPATPTMTVAITGLSVSGSSQRTAKATVKVVNTVKPTTVVAGASVTGRWSYLPASGYSAPFSAYASTLTTTSSGTNVFSSKKIRRVPGSFVFQVTGVTKSGMVWDRVAVSRTATAW